MYDYGYSYGYGLIGGNTYNPLINYDWSTTTTSGLRYLKDVGSTPTYNASMYFGRGAYFNGVDQSAEVLPFSDVKFLRSTDWNVSFRKDSISTGYLLWLGSIDARLTGTELRIYDGASKSIIYGLDSRDISLNYTSATNTYELYSDGILTGSIVATAYAQTNGFNIGCRPSVGYGQGVISDLFLFNRTLNQSEITQSYEQPELFYAMAQADSTCVLNMPMCETSSTVRNYKTGTNHPITNYTTSVRDNAKNLQYGLQTCKFVRDSLGVIQSASNYLECDEVGYANTGWIPSSVNSATIEYICYIGLSGLSGTNNPNFRLGCNNGKAFFQTAASALETNTNVNNNNYNLLTIEYNQIANNINCYVNGFLVGNRAIGNISVNSLAFEIGQTAGEYHSKTPIRLFKVHNKALTQAEITANYNSYQNKGLLS